MSSQEWYTPQWIVDHMHATLEEWTILDPCSNEKANETVQAHKYYTKEENGLEQPWDVCKSLFINPPGVQPGLSRAFLIKARKSKLPTYYVGFSSLQLQWAAPMLDAILFPNRRTKFVAGEGQRVTSPSVYCFLGYIGIPKNFIRLAPHHCTSFVQQGCY